MASNRYGCTLGVGLCWCCHANLCGLPALESTLIRTMSSSATPECFWLTGNGCLVTTLSYKKNTFVNKRGYTSIAKYYKFQLNIFHKSQALLQRMIWEIHIPHSELWILEYMRFGKRAYKSRPRLDQLYIDGRYCKQILSLEACCFTVRSFSPHSALYPSNFKTTKHIVTTAELLAHLCVPLHKYQHATRIIQKEILTF